MKETSTILRKLIKYKGLIKFIVFIVFVILLKTVSMQNEDKQMVSKDNQLKLTAGFNKHVKTKVKSEELNIAVEKVESDIVAISETNEIIYTSYDEIEISKDMDLSKVTGTSKEEFCKRLENFKYDYDGFYKRNAEVIWEYGQIYNVNEIFMCAVFALESGFGTSEKHKSAHNYGSIMSKNKLVKYGSDEQGIEANFKLISNHYLKPDGKFYKGVTLYSIEDTYCPPTEKCPSWGEEVFKCMQLFLEE